MMSEAKKRVPKRRFKEFLNTGDWEQRKLGNIVDFLDGQRKPLKESDRIKGKYPYYGASGIIDYINDYLFDENLVLLSEDGANIIDRNYPICFIATGKYWVNNHAHVLKVKAGVIDKFICESLERLDYTKFNTGTAQPKLNQDICQKIVITIPNEDEQKCISEFLDRINNIITLHQSKLDKLQATKKALLQEMFPEEGQDKPKRRFKGFSDAWEQRKLGEYANFRRGSFPQPYGNKEWYDGVGSAPFVQVVDVGDNLSLVECTKQRISKLAQPMSVYAEKGSVLVTLQGSIGRVAVSQYDAFIDRTILIFQGYKYKTNSYFWAYIIKNKFFEEALKAPGGTIKTITKEVLSNFIILYPKFSEQEQIGSFFEKLDKLITLHQRKLDKLKNLKQAYLNEMFV